MRVHPSWSVSPRMTLHLLTVLSLKRSDRHSEQGLSLIECLVAIIIVSLTVLAITPPILLGAATRVQSRRADQAFHIAQGEIDRVRTIVERGTYLENELPVDAGNINPKTVAVATTSPATGPLLSSGTCTGTRYPLTPPMAVNGLARVDVNGDCQPEFMMQVFRVRAQRPTASDPPYAFVMGVRVYAHNPGEAQPTLSQEQASLVLGTTARDRRSGNQRQALAVLYAPVIRNDQSRSLGQLCQQAGGTCNF